MNLKNNEKIDEKDSQKSNIPHYPVMIQNVFKRVENFIIRQEKDYQVKMIDCCIGTGGHSLYLLE
jgi:16S rRNA C1402 N4-methylase RsmH